MKNVLWTMVWIIVLTIVMYSSSGYDVRSLLLGNTLGVILVLFVDHSVKRLYKKQKEEK
jgi:hypothetical protein